MKHYLIQKSQLKGSALLPSSKSQSIRAIFFASLANGNSTITNPLNSPDIKAMVRACRELGADIQTSNHQLFIQGLGGEVKTPQGVIDAGNSGQVLRFIAPLAGLGAQTLEITGDHSICHNRPIQPLIDALPNLGVQCHSIKNNGFAPIKASGTLRAGTTTLDGQDSQPVSALIMAAPFAQGTTILKVNNPGETPWIDLTLSWLDRFNIEYDNDDYQCYSIKGRKIPEGFNYHVPGDLSSLAFPVVAALITSSDIVLHGVDLNEPQGDKAILEILKQMGAKITYCAQEKTLSVKGPQKLNGMEMDINHCIDAICILAVVGCFAQGTTVIKGAAIAKHKESNRLEAMHDQLKKMGADISIADDGLIIKESKLHGAQLASYHDHRIAMSLAIAALDADGATTIKDIDCVNKSFPDFASWMEKLGADIKVIL